MTGHHRPWAALILSFGILASACGNDDDPAVAQNPGGTAGGGDESSDEDAGSASEITVSADDIAFDADQIDVNAGEETTVTFENIDEGIQHNFHVQAGDVDVKTDIAPGPDTQVLSFTIDEAGDYTFICDVHPTQMTGELIVS